MATYPPPANEQGSIFNPDSWIQQPLASVDTAYLDANYCRYPVAQGEMNFADTNTAGNSVVTQNIVLDGTYLTNYLEFPDGTKQYTAGGGTAGVAVLADTQEFTGVNTFNNAGGVILTDGTNSSTLTTNTNGLKLSKGLTISATSGTNSTSLFSSPSINGQLIVSGALQVNSTLSLLSGITGATSIVSTGNIQGSSVTSSTAQAYPLANSNNLASITYVNGAIASVPVVAISSQTLVGNYDSGQSITIPTGCVGFTVSVIGTGGFAGDYSVGVPSGTYTNYYYQIPTTGGGAQVTKSNNIISIPKQGTYLTSTLQIYTNASGTFGGAVSVLLLNGTRIIEANNGTNAGGGDTTGTPYTNSTYGSFTTYQGRAGAQPSPNYSYTSPNVGQLGGGNLGGGLSGLGVGGSQNCYGQGQLYNQLSGPSYGLTVYPPSPINYGGCIITFYT